MHLLEEAAINHLLSNKSLLNTLIIINFWGFFKQVVLGYVIQGSSPWHSKAPWQMGEAQRTQGLLPGSMWHIADTKLHFWLLSWGRTLCSVFVCVSVPEAEVGTVGHNRGHNDTRDTGPWLLSGCMCHVWSPTSRTRGLTDTSLFLCLWGKQDWKDPRAISWGHDVLAHGFSSWPSREGSRVRLLVLPCACHECFCLRELMWVFVCHHPAREKLLVSPSYS